MSREPGTKDVDSEILEHYLPVDTADLITAPPCPAMAGAIRREFRCLGFTPRRGGQRVP